MGDRGLHPARGTRRPIQERLGSVGERQPARLHGRVISNFPEPKTSRSLGKRGVSGRRLIWCEIEIFVTCKWLLRKPRNTNVQIGLKKRSRFRVGCQGLSV